MKICFFHQGAEYCVESFGAPVLPVLDRDDQQHIVRWGGGDGDDMRVARGHWYSQDFLRRCDATWVRIPALRYEHQTMYGESVNVVLNEPLAGGLVKVKGAGVRVYLVSAPYAGRNSVVPMLYSEAVQSTGYPS